MARRKCCREALQETRLATSSDYACNAHGPPCWDGCVFRTQNKYSCHATGGWFCILVHHDHGQHIAHSNLHCGYVTWGAGDTFAVLAKEAVT